MGKNEWFAKKNRFFKFMSFSNNKIKNYCSTKYPTKDKVKKYKRTMCQWIDNNKSMYNGEDLAYYLILYNNLGVTKADGFRKNLGKNQLKINQFEVKEIIAAIMKIFVKEIMVRQYKINGLPFDVYLCFIVHKVVLEVDEDGCIYYNKEKHQKRQKLIGNLGFTFIRINPDVENFDLDVEIARICN